MVDRSRKITSGCDFLRRPFLTGGNAHMKKVFFILGKIIIFLIKAAISIACLATALLMLTLFVSGFTDNPTGTQSDKTSYTIMDRFDMFMTNTISDSLDGILSIKKVYWLSDDDLVAPEPNQDNFGATDDPSTLQFLLDDASGLLDGQDALFKTDVEIMKGSTVQYYLDETILVITWKQVIDNSVYTISEVKIADPSQFRRFLADGQFASDSKYLATEMASSVNAVVASNGDFYSFRDLGIVVYDGMLMRSEGYYMDTCFIKGNGDLGMVYAREMLDESEMEKYIEENQVRFSLSFGPILIKDGEVRNQPATYPVGEGKIPNARAALGQLDSLHYVLVAVNAEPPYAKGHTLKVFSENLKELGCEQAYNLDGGQSATIVMNDELVNYVYQRLLSDIIYFATAIPNGE